MYPINLLLLQRQLLSNSPSGGGQIQSVASQAISVSTWTASPSKWPQSPTRSTETPSIAFSLSASLKTLSTFSRRVPLPTPRDKHVQQLRNHRNDRGVHKGSGWHLLWGKWREVFVYRRKSAQRRSGENSRDHGYFGVFYH